MYNKIINIIKSSNDIAIFMHINPDGDALGSSLAMYTFLKKLGKNVHCFTPGLTNIIQPKFLFLTNVDAYNKELSPNYELAIALDCGDAARLSEENFKVFKKAKTKIVIDHHESHESFSPLTLLEANSASTTQIVYKLLKMYDKNNIDYDIALQLYTGLVTDSGSFSYSSTSSQTHKIAAELLEYGIDAGHVSRKVMKDTPYNVFNLKNRVLSKTKFYSDNQIAVINFNPEDFQSTQTTESDTEGLINNILDIDSVEIAIAIAEVKDKAYKVSIRSKDKVKASDIAGIFGGGGHANAAGCRVYGYYEDVYNKLISISTEMLNSDA